MYSLAICISLSCWAFSALIFIAGEEYNEDYETAAHQAAAEGNGQLLVTAIERDPGSIQQRDNEGDTVY